MEDIVVFLGLNVFISDHSKPQLQKFCFQSYNHKYSMHTLLDKAFKGTVVNRALPSV